MFKWNSVCATIGLLIVVSFVLVVSTTVSNANRAVIIYSFGGPNGAYPEGNLIADSAGNLYGTTSAGGNAGCNGELGCGIVFKLTPNPPSQTYRETVLHVFASGNDGANPTGGLVLDKAGNLYGTTVSGGGSGCTVAIESPGCGTIFKIASDGTESVLHTFCNKPSCADGSAPIGNILIDSDGNLFGVTNAGGHSSKTCYSCGTVFRLSPSGMETVLYTFCSQPNCTDGSSPNGSLIRDSAGDLIGTTETGGHVTAAGTLCPLGCGTIFRVARNGSETVLYTFCSQPNCADSGLPVSGLIRDNAGNLYGTASGPYGGAVFELATNNTYTILHSFTRGLDGCDPFGGLVAYKHQMFGTTLQCGSENRGTVFAISSDATEKSLYSFRSRVDGKNPRAALILSGTNELFGTTAVGGDFSQGTVFEIEK